MQLRDYLTGGDRRSIGRANEALAITRWDPAAVEELAELARDVDPLVSMRACDALEKLVLEKPGVVQPYRHLFVEKLTNDSWQIRLQCVRAIPLLEWSDGERLSLIDQMRGLAADDNKLVRCWSLDSLELLTHGDPAYRDEIEEHLADFMSSGIPSMAARARAIAKRLSNP